MGRDTALLSARECRTLDVQGCTRVSELSLFSQHEWDYSAELGNVARDPFMKSINWGFEVVGGRNFLEPEFASMLLTLKHLAYILLFLPKRRKIGTVIRIIIGLRNFVRFLIDSPRPVYRFQDVLETDIERYVAHSRLRQRGGGTVSTGRLAEVFRNLNRLYDYRQYLTDHLRFRPTKGKSPNQVAGHRRSERSTTKAIPDGELKALIDVALDYVNRRAPLILGCLRKFAKFAESIDPYQIRSSDLKSRYLQNNFFRDQKHYRSSMELNTELVLLRTACLIIIAFSTGMRISELVEIRRKCLRQVVDADHGVFHWVDSMLFKTQKLNSGSPRSWMCGPLAAQAVKVLKEMGWLLGARSDSAYLFLSFGHFYQSGAGGGRLTKTRALPMTTATANMKAFCAAHGLSQDVHPHRFRRTFARNIVRYSSTSILALKQHFKHWSIHMTDWYVGLDLDLIEDLEAERLLLSIETMEKICTQPVGGAGGRRFTQELERRITEGRLPRNFRGKAGAEFRRVMTKDLLEAGMIVIPCGTFTNCVFQPDEALCTKGKRPLINRCNPYDCTNSYILEENAPFYRRKLAIVQTMYDQLSEDEKNGPKGLYYQREMTKARKAFEPFEK
jgi:integrase